MRFGITGTAFAQQHRHGIWQSIAAFLTAFAMSVLLTSFALAQSVDDADQAIDEPSVTQADAVDAPPYPSGLDDRGIDLSTLQLRLIPLTADELLALADVWQAHARAATQDIVDTSLKIRSSDAATAEALRAERLNLLQIREAVFEKFKAVVSSLEAKGGDPEIVQALRSYITAITVEETSRWTLQEFYDSAVAWLFSADGGVQLGFGIAVVFASFFALLVAARVVRAWVGRALGRLQNLSKLLRGFLVMVAYWLTIAFGLMMVLALLGVNVTPLFALVGGASFIIAFALQDTLGNLAAGLMIMINRPFDEGDFVSVGGISGTVQSVSIVSTTVATPDNRVIVIPNGKVWGDVITNNSASETRRVDLEFSIGYDDSIEKSQSVIENVVHSHPAVLSDPAPVIRVNQLSASSVDFVCRPWVRSEDYLAAYWDLTQSVKEAFDANDITIPYPQTDMHIRLPDGTCEAFGLAPRETSGGSS